MTSHNFTYDYGTNYIMVHTAMAPTESTTRRRSHPGSRWWSNGEQTSLGRYLKEINRYPLLTAAEEVELAQAIEAGVEAQRHLNGGASTLPAAPRQLEEQVRSGEAAKERFLAANLRLVVANARRYVPPYGVELLDLVQEGNLGLVRAVEKFDWRRGFKFSTYATWWIRKAISKALSEKTRVFRIPSHVSESLPLVRQAQPHLAQELGRPPRPDELADATGLTLSQVHAALEAPATVSLQEPVGEDGAILADFIEEDQAIEAETQVELADIADRLRQAIARLPRREGRIVALRYGLTDRQPHTFEDIGEEFGLTAERIRQLEKHALCRLRHPTYGLREADFL